MDRAQIEINSGCVGKIPHASWTEAQQRIKRQSRRLKGRRNDQRRVEIYRCKHCRNYHVGGTD